MKQRRKLQSGCFIIAQSELAMTGNGCMRWARVIADDDQASALSLFYLVEDGMELMGVFYPAGSPAINYKTA